MQTKKLGVLGLKLETLSKLGWKNIIRVIFYRLGKKSGFYEKTLPIGEPYALSLTPSCFSATIRGTSLSGPEQTVLLKNADRLRKGSMCYFSHFWFDVGSPPSWFNNPFKKSVCKDNKIHWSKLPDFSKELGDIKTIWELSRFAWALDLAKAYRLTSEKSYLDTLNAWLADWTKHNPVNAGPNWKCGQEAGIRMINLLLAARVLGQAPEKLNKGIIRFIWEHCQRIEPTLFYAIAQNNNHGMCEAAALFIGGACLTQQQIDPSKKKKAIRWKRLGRKWLEDRVRKLIENDGSFSQYSVNYHRMMLNILSYTEIWRKILNERPFSKQFYHKAAQATKWLFIFTNSNSGQAPNIGSNDGTLLFNLSNDSYLDFRPSVNLAGCLFLNYMPFSETSIKQISEWIDVDLSLPRKPHSILKKDPILFKDGGYCFLNKDNIELFIRFPSFKFRPHHCDMLHMDLWVNGQNIICDSGTYSYNCDEAYLTYFPSTLAHSTIQLDGRDQMKRAGRFLFAGWPESYPVENISRHNETYTWQVGYRDFGGAEHIRKIILKSNKVIVVDKVRDFQYRAILRWHLAPFDWILEGSKCSSFAATINIESTVPIKQILLTSGYRSLYYLKKEKIPVLETVVDKPGKIITQIILKT